MDFLNADKQCGCTSWKVSLSLSNCR